MREVRGESPVVCFNLGMRPKLPVIGAAALALSCFACGEEEQRNPPPVGGASAGPNTAGVASTDPEPPGTSGGMTTASSSSSSGPGTTSDGPGDDSTGAPFTVLTGGFEDGLSGFALPITCLVQFHLPGQIDPSSGQETAVAFSRPFTIDAFPQPFAIESDDVPGLVMPGDSGFVTANCDVDGDGLYDDNAGGYYPSLPLLEVTVPASSLTIPIGTI